MALRFSSNNPSLLGVTSSSYEGKVCSNSLVSLFCKLVLKPFKNGSKVLCHWVYVQATKIVFSLKQGLTNRLCWLALWSLKGPSHSSCHGAVNITFCYECQPTLFNLIFLIIAKKLYFPQVYKNIFSVE